MPSRAPVVLFALQHCCFFKVNVIIAVCSVFDCVFASEKGHSFRLFSRKKVAKRSTAMLYASANGRMQDEQGGTDL